jgi:hypothetical protein
MLPPGQTVYLLPTDSYQARFCMIFISLPFLTLC